MKHNLETLTRNFTREKLEAVKKGLREKLVYAWKNYEAWMGKGKHRKDEQLAMEWKLLWAELKEVLGEA